MREVDLPELGEGDVLVKIAVVSLNYRDTEGLFSPSISYLYSVTSPPFSRAASRLSVADMGG